MLRTYTRGVTALRTNLRLLQSAIVFAAIALTACQDLIGPKEEKETPVAGAFMLADVGGNQLPATIYEGPWNINGQQLNIRLSIQAGGLALTGSAYELDIGMFLTMSGQTAPAPIIVRGTFTKTGSQIVLQSDNPKDRPVTATMKGSGTITIALDLIGDGHPQVYTFRK